MKKKCLALMLSLTLVMSMTACGGSEAETGDDSSAAVSGEADTPEEVDNSAEVPAEEEEADVPADTEEHAGDEISLWDVAKAETPDLSDTTWNICGGYFEGKEMTQEELDALLETYGGTCQFVFDAEGGAKMVQGGGELPGTYEYLENGDVGIIIDANGTELRYGCVFTDLNGLTMIAVSDEDGQNGLYFAQ